MGERSWVEIIFGRPDERTRAYDEAAAEVARLQGSVDRTDMVIRMAAEDVRWGRRSPERLRQFVERRERYDGWLKDAKVRLEIAADRIRALGVSSVGEYGVSENV